WCTDTEVKITGVSRDRIGVHVLSWKQIGPHPQGSYSVDVSEWTEYTLTAICNDLLPQFGAVTSAPVDVHVYVPPTQYSYYCFEADCESSGCTTLSVASSSEAAASSAFDSMYPSQSGCTTSSIGCNEVTSACG